MSVFAPVLLRPRSRVAAIAKRCGDAFVRGSILAAALAACTSAGQMRRDAPSAPAGVAPPLEAAGAVRGGAGAAPAQALRQQLLRRGDMALESPDPGTTARRVEQVATAMGGLVARSSNDGRSDARVDVRVPSERLDAAMDEVARLGRVERRATSATDVTEQLVDLDARIATLRSTRDRLRALLGQASAVRDVIEVERELQRVQGDLESLERRVEALRGQVAMSDLSVTITREVVLGPLGALLRGIGVAIGKLFVWR